MATNVQLTNLTRGWLHLGSFYKIAPQNSLSIVMTMVRRDEALAYLIYRFAVEGKIFGKLDGIVVEPAELLLEFTDPMSTSRGIEFPVDAPIGKLFFRSDIGINGEMYLRDNAGWVSMAGALAAHGNTHLPASFGGTDPIPGIERLQDMYACTLAESISDLVYQAGGDTVERADASAMATMPAIGFIESKGTPISCVVTTTGLLAGFLVKYAGLGGLTPDTTYFADPLNPGLITSVPASIPGHVSQRIGYAKNADELLVEIDSPIML